MYFFIYLLFIHLRGGLSLVQKPLGPIPGTYARPITFHMEKFEVAPEHKVDALLNLKLRQLNGGFETNFLQVKNVALEKMVLREKKLVTYFVTIEVGDQLFRVLMDTGSSEFWIPSTACKTTRCQRHRQYDIKKAQYPRFRIYERAQMQIEYQSGLVEGPFVLETVKLGEVEVPQLVGIADRVDIKLLDDVVWDGILGLAFPTEKLESQGIRPFFDTVIAEGALTKQGLSNQFAYYIDDDKGAITLGGADCELLATGTSDEDCQDKFHFVPLSEKTYWTVIIDDIKLHYPGRDKAEGGFCPPRGCTAIVDTGTYLVYGPADQVHTMLAGHAKMCHDYSTMPDITFEMRVHPHQPPVSLTLRPSDYILKFQLKDSYECVVGVSPDEDTIWTLGQVFLRSFYTLFDRDGDRIGFAPLPHHHPTPIHSSPDDPRLTELSDLRQ